MDIFNPETIKLLPQFMQNDTANKALATSIDYLIATPAKDIPSLRRWDQIDNLSNAQLDEIAWEFDLDFYDKTASIDYKRQLIKSSYRILEKRGTKWAVEELVRSTFGFGKVVEWFEYGGQPYCFRIYLDVVLTDEAVVKFKQMIDKVKNVRSYLETIEVVRSASAPIYVGIGNTSWKKSIVYGGEA